MTEEDLIRVSCPNCGKRVKTRARFGGQKITCPNCAAQVKIPGHARPKSDDDDWLRLDESSEALSPDNMVVEPNADLSVDENQTSSSRTEPILADSMPPADDVEELRLAPAFERKPREIDPLAPHRAKDAAWPAPASSPNRRKTDIPADEQLPHRRPMHRETPPQSGVKDPDVVAPADQDQFRFPCKVCGTVMYQRHSAIGKEITCPDCHSKLIVTAPKKPVAKPTKIVPMEDDDIRIAPAEGKAKSDSLRAPDVVKETLERARAELAEEEGELKESTYDFDTSGWLLRTFSFVLDPVAMTLLIAYGLVLGGVVAFTWWMESLQDQLGPGVKLVAILVYAGVAAPVTFSLLANGLAILEAAANQERRVRDWPVFNMGEWMGDALAPLFAFALACVPGGLLFWLARSMDLNYIGVGALLFSIWLFFPILLLGLLDNNSNSNPISWAVLKSLRSRSEAWGGMMIQNAIASFALWLLLGLARSMNTSGGFVFGIGIAFYTMFVSQQIGVLASRIAEVTSLAFEKRGKDPSSD